MIYELARHDPRIVFIGSDLGPGTLSRFKEEMPSRFFMEGVAEANVIGMAAGLALNGKIVYVNTIASFLTRRCYEQVVLDLCLHNVPVRLIGNGGGLVYAPLGPTHETVEDLAIMRALPNMTVVAPADAEEMKRLMPLTVDWPGPMYIRLAKGYDPVVTDPGAEFAIGRGILMRRGSDALVVTTGVMLQVALDAAARLERERKIATAVLHLPTVKPLDVDGLRRAARDVRAVLTIEEHSVHGGLGGAVAECLLESDLPRFRFKRLGLPDVFPGRYGSQKGLFGCYGLTTDALCAAVLAMVG